MDAVNFSFEWQNLQKHRQQLNDAIKLLQCKLNNLASDPKIRQLLEEKNNLKNAIRDLQDKINCIQCSIAGGLSFLEYRRGALHNSVMEKDLKKRALKCRDRIRLFKKTKGLEGLIAKEEEIIKQIEAPLPQVEKDFWDQNAIQKKEMSELAKLIDENLARIAFIDAHYHQAKICLQDRIREIECMKVQCRVDEKKWATQDKKHLEWMLLQNPSERECLITYYQYRFPGEDISELSVQKPITSEGGKTPKPSKKRHHCCSKPLLKIEQNKAQTVKQWSFWITFNTSHPGEKLPYAKDQCIKALENALKKDCSIKPELIYAKLMIISGMSLPQRQTIHRIVDMGLDISGWQRYKVAGGHRLFFEVNEKDCKIRFLLRPRKEVYKKHP